MRDPKSKARWYRLTPGRFLLGLLAAEGFLLLSERFCWFAFNATKGWTVLIAIALVASGVLVGVLWFTVSVVLRRGFQFSMGSLLLSTVVLAIPCSWFTVNIERAQREKEALDALATKSKSVYIEYDYVTNFRGRYVYSPDGQPIRIIEPPGPVWLRDWLGEHFFASVTRINCPRSFCDDDIAILEGLEGLQFLYLSLSQITDVGLEHLAEHTRLETLHLWSTRVTDDGMEHLKDLRRLRYLDLADTQITDAGLANLKGLTKLETLLLSGNKITDAGLEHLKELNNLEILYLDGTQITDAGLMQLKMIASLEYLSVYETAVTDHGARGLQRALPKCAIELEYPNVRSEGR